MKTKRFQKKLLLNKATVANITGEQMNRVLGGVTGTVDEGSCDTVCYTGPLNDGGCPWICTKPHD